MLDKVGGRREMAEIIYREESFKIVGAAMEVHSVLGRGFSEPIFQEAFGIELADRSIPFEKEPELVVYCKGNPLTKKYPADFVAYGKIILELKAGEADSPGAQGTSVQLPARDRLQTWPDF